jgi:hypothetical protein
MKTGVFVKLSVVVSCHARWRMDLIRAKALEI